MSVKPCSSNLILCQSIGWRWLEKPLTGLLLTVALMVFADQFYNSRARGAEIPPNEGSPASIASTAAIAPSQPVTQPTLDGTYLYGQSLQPEQIGATYMVFEVNQNRVIGAFYMPYSSFDCFQGEVQANRLALTVVNSYEQTSYAYQVERQPATAIATNRGGAVASLALPGYHAIASVSDNDHRLVATCKAAYRNSR